MTNQEFKRDWEQGKDGDTHTGCVRCRREEGDGPTKVREIKLGKKALDFRTQTRHCSRRFLDVPNNSDCSPRMP